jgi:amidohydrolase
MPDRAVDPIVASAHIITALQTLISRETSPFSPAVITIGTIHAGTAFNIIPETAVMQGTMRSFSAEHRAKLIRRIHEVTTGVATALDASCEVHFEDGCPPCVNDAAMTEVVYKAAVDAVGTEHVDTSEGVLASGSDDMSFFLDAVPGCYFVVGSGNREKETDFSHHHPRFNIDEDALPIAVEILTRATLDFISK